MTRISSILFVLWVFLLGPGLCGAGLLSHACVVDQSNYCSHEELCAQDPCAKLTIRTGVTALAHDSDEAAPVSPAATISIRSILSSPSGPIARPLETALRHNIPVPSADLPLLI